MVKIKICGIKRPEDIKIVNKYLPDYIGFVFAPSKRQITHDTACRLKRQLNKNIQSAGVFVGSDKREILNLFNNNIINIAQLHGGESEEYISDLKDMSNNKLKIIKAIEMSQDINLEEYNNSNADYLLLDSGKGSGKTFDWDLIKTDLKKDFFIAGGLNKSNICEAVLKFNPYAVDLSSALETDGFKDENKIREIMELIHEKR